MFTILITCTDNDGWIDCVPTLFSWAFFANAYCLHLHHSSWWAYSLFTDAKQYQQRWISLGWILLEHPLWLYVAHALVPGFASTLRRTFSHVNFFRCAAGACSASWVTEGWDHMWALRNLSFASSSTQEIWPCSNYCSHMMWKAHAAS